MPKITPEALFILQSLLIVGGPFFLRTSHRIRKYVPLVVLQIIFSIILGPSVLGYLSPASYNFLFPKESLQVLSGLSWMALLLFGFLTGTHFEAAIIKNSKKQFAITSISVTFIPALLGALVALLLYRPELVGAHATPVVFALGMAIAVGTTALPVLGSILTELNLIDKEIGKKTLGYATFGDLFIWFFIAILIAAVNTDASRAIFTIAGGCGFLLFLWYVVQPHLISSVKSGYLTSDINRKQLVYLLILLFSSAFIAEVIGIHYLFGAFIFGAIIPKAIAQGVRARLEQFVYVCLMPFFFILTGLKTVFHIEGPTIWMLFGVMFLVASLGKILSAAIPERLFGSSWKEAFQIGSLMQTKGLMEIVVLNILISAQIISSVTFSSMMLVAVTTTVITQPILLLTEKLGAKASS